MRYVRETKLTPAPSRPTARTSKPAPARSDGFRNEAYSSAVGSTFTKRLRRRPIAPGVARNELAAWLDGALPRERVDTVKQAVSELVTNAVTHRTGEIVARAHQADNSVRASVNALVSRWGIEEVSTHVWFELDGADDGL